MPVRLPAFVVTTWLLAMLPGAGQALILRQTLTRGREAAWTTIAGTATGLLVWTALAAAGLSTVLLAHPDAYLAIRVTGGLVLGCLGVSTLRAMRRTTMTPAPDDRGSYAAGLATNLGNPKAGVFAVSLLPQFVSPNGHVAVGIVLLGALWAATTTLWYLLFVWAVDRGRLLVARPAVTAWLHGITGTVLVLLGVAVALGA
jgi:threonine/homoserine/homoserine lactone efflux protein